MKEVGAKVESGLSSITGIFGGAASSAKHHGQTPTKRGMKSLSDMRFGDILDSDDFNDFTEKFDEATYNKKLGKLRTDVGD